MKFGQLIKYNKKNIFFEKSYAKYGGEIIARYFSRNSKFSISLDQWSKVLYSVFIAWQAEAIEIYWK